MSVASFIRDNLYVIAFRICTVWVLTFTDLTYLYTALLQAYGGLRGAVAFCLVITLSEDILPHVKLFQTTTMVVIFFTVFVQVWYSN